MGHASLNKLPQPARGSYDIAEIAVPAAPAAAVRRIFVDTNTGQFSVQTAANETITLEPVYVRAFVATGDTTIVPTKNQVIVCEEYLVEGTGGLTLEGTAQLCVLGGAA